MADANKTELQRLTRSLLSDLHRLQKMVQPITIDSTCADAGEVYSQMVQLQQHFQAILAKLAATSLTPEVEQRLRPYQTEAHRLFRLLGVEAMKLRAAKQSATLVKGRAHITTQLSKLQPFIQAIADETSNL